MIWFAGTKNAAGGSLASRQRAMVSDPSSRQQESRYSSASTLCGIPRVPAGLPSETMPPSRRAGGEREASSTMRLRPKMRVSEGGERNADLFFVVHRGHRPGADER